MLLDSHMGLLFPLPTITIVQVRYSFDVGFIRLFWLLPFAIHNLGTTYVYWTCLTRWTISTFFQFVCRSMSMDPFPSRTLATCTTFWMEVFLKFSVLYIPSTSIARTHCLFWPISFLSINQRLLVLTANSYKLIIFFNFFTPISRQESCFDTHVAERMKDRPNQPLLFKIKVILCEFHLRAMSGRCRQKQLCCYQQNPQC